MTKIFDKNVVHYIGIDSNILSYDNRCTYLFNKYDNFVVKPAAELVNKTDKWWLIGVYDAVYKKNTLVTIPENVRKDIIDGRCKIILSDQTESVNYISTFENIHCFIDNLCLPRDRLVLLTGSLSIEKDYNDYCESNMIDKQNRALVIGDYTTLYHIFTVVPSIDFKRFMYLSRRPSEFSAFFTFLFFNNKKIFDNMHISFSSTNPYTSEFQVDEQYLKRSLVEFGYDPQRYNKEMHDFLNAIPFTLDTSTFTQGEAISSKDIFLYYHSSDFLVVRETLFRNDTFITEKTWKAIAMKKPFILVGSLHTLRYLKELGFRTFDIWIDESYDNETNLQKRAMMIYNEVDKLANLDPDTFRKMIAEMMEVVDHNYYHLKETFSNNVHGI
jgi:hypothetical protein